MKLSNYYAHLCVYVLQSHNQILRAAASGDVAALRRVAGDTGPVLLTTVQNKVCPIQTMQCIVFCVMNLIISTAYELLYSPFSVWLDSSALCCLQWSS